MKISSLFLFSILAAFMFAQCDSSKKSSENDSHSEDTFQSPPEPEPAPAPGSAKIRGKIVSIDSTSGNDGIVQIKVTKIEAYGAGTPQLSINKPMEVAIRKTDIAKYKKMMDSNSPIQAVLSSRQQQTLEGMGDSGPSWRLNSVKEIN